VHRAAFFYTIRRCVDL
jgi:bloom syndrome protein